MPSPNIRISTNANDPASTDIEALQQAIEPLVKPIRQEIRALREEVRSLRGQRDPDRLVDKTEAAELLGVSERTVDTLIAAEEIGSIKVRRCRRIPRRALNAYIRRKTDREVAL